MSAVFLTPYVEQDKTADHFLNYDCGLFTESFDELLFRIGIFCVYVILVFGDGIDSIKLGT